MRKSLFGILILLLFSCQTNKELPLSPETALQKYLENGDDNYHWVMKEKYSVEGKPVTAYDLVLTSQQWREHTWKHQLTILVPENLTKTGSLLFITGGSNKKTEPNFKKKDDDTTLGMAMIAEKNQAIVSIIRQTPNQPLYDDLVEDELISFTLHNFKNDGDYTWPLLFPMVKTAVRAMDAVQEFAKSDLDVKVDQFVVSGASKRGWTTWLTGAMDPRVMAIAPMVIDVLNMPVSLDYQIEVWKDYSVQIQDYVELEIPQTSRTEKGAAITTMVDPYSYREKLTMPKLIFIGTNDEYWPVDAIKNYLDDIPGKNLIEYVPNAGHGLGDGVQALQALSSFLAITLNGKEYPTCEWNVEENGKEVMISTTTTSDKLIDALIWSADSEDRDFRDEEFGSKSLNAKQLRKIDTTVSFPESGYRAFYIDLKYVDPIGEEYVVSTRMFVADSTHVL
tara:strand:- start:138123 stop:139472 length:1350 start_codon:yes stop_codon:yes gene_type:complete